VFGSGLFGADGTSALVSGQDGSGAVLYSGTGTDFSLLDADVRMTVSGDVVAAVPEPETWALMLAGLSGIGLVLRRARKAG
jgi:PEP-CTERM motif